MKTYYIIHYQM